MSLYRWVILGVMSQTMILASASADAIRPSGEASATASLVGPPEVAFSGLEVLGTSRLTLSPAHVDGPWTDLTRRPLLNLDLAGPSILDRATSSSSSEALARPELPKDPLLGASSERIIASWPPLNSEAGADGESDHNIRIPEPASVALVAAGLIGLIAHYRLRRNLHPKVGKNPA